MRVLLCIDDTDNLESIGTGKLLEKLCETIEIKGLAIPSFISRHQLYIHDSIAYTSHNSSMCCELEVEQDNFEVVLDTAREYILTNAAEGSDPGLCMIKIKELGSDGVSEIISYGKRAKSEVLKKSNAYNLAENYPKTIFLSEHGGTGEGIIGALAGCGLRLYGNDGRIKGKFKPLEPLEVMSVKEFCNKYTILFAIDEEFKVIHNNDSMVCKNVIKKIFWNHQPTIVLEREEGLAKWKVMSKNDLNKKGIGR